jgi:hypothetical protein
MAVVSAVVVGEAERERIKPAVIRIPVIEIPGIPVAEPGCAPPVTDSDTIRRIVGRVVGIIVELPPGGIIIAGLRAVAGALVVSGGLVVPCSPVIVSFVHVSPGRPHLCVTAGQKEERNRSKQAANEKWHWVFHNCGLVMKR